MLEQRDSELLSAFIDGELTDEELKRVNSFLAASAEWRDELERMRAVKTLIAGAPVMKMPADLLQQLEREAAGLAPDPQRTVWTEARRRTPQAWLWTGSAAAVLVLSVWIGVRQSEADALSLAPLVAAHMRQDVGTSLGRGIFAASAYSEQLKNSTHEEN